MIESWTRLGDAPFARVNHQAIFLNGCLYVFGGFNSQLNDINYTSHQLDVFKWNVYHNKWEELKYPLRLKAWDCNTKTWTSDPLSSADGSINPTLRFGHTVVAWRGRGWLFGGRTQQHACPNQLYLFEPGYYSHSYDSPTSSNSERKKPRNTTINIVHPCWAEVVGTTGATPSPRDGHAATVLENAMFIFGGFDDVFGSYDNFVYRFDFITWSWTRIQIHPHPCGGPGLSASAQVQIPWTEGPAIPPTVVQRAQADEDEAHDSAYVVLQNDVPLPRDFSCLISHQGRIFLFGGRSELAARSGMDVYDSALWELVPLQVNERVLSDSDQSITDQYCYSPVLPDQCGSCSVNHLHHLATLGSLQRMAWEEETGNWKSPEYWATAPPRPCCLWRYASRPPGELAEHMVSNNHRSLSPFTGCRSRWSSGNATWLRLHPGHGLQLPNHLLPLLSQAARNSQLNSGVTAITSPHGRRSLSHWAYGGQLYISFGTVRCQTAEQWQLHYHDVWRFSLTDNTWTQITTEGFVNDSPMMAHWPSARRRAVAGLYLPYPRVPVGIHPDHVSTNLRPLVYVFGGTQPRVLDKHGTTPGCRTHHANLSAPARPYTLFTSGIPCASNQGEPITQNRLLGLGDGDSVSLLNFPGTIIPRSTAITSPMAILLVNSPRTFHTEQSTPFYLVMIVPAHLPTSFFSSPAQTQPCQHQSALSRLCVVSFAELGALFRTPLHGAPFLDTVCYGVLDKLLYTNEPESELDQAQLYTALRLAWFAVLHRSQRSNGSVAAMNEAGSSRLHMLIVQQQQQQQQASMDPVCGDTGDHSDMDISEPMGESSYSPLILEQHSYVLTPNGEVFRESLDCVQGFLWFTLLPVVCSALITTVDLLLESTRRLLACLRQGNLRSFVLGPLVFCSTAPCPDCSVNDQRPVHVWIDSSQLTGLIPVSEPSSSSSSSRPDAQGSRDCRHQTIASLLIQFLPHLRSTLELEFATQHLPNDPAPRLTEPLQQLLPSTSGTSRKPDVGSNLTKTVGSSVVSGSVAECAYLSLGSSYSVTTPSTLTSMADSVSSIGSVRTLQPEHLLLPPAEDRDSSDSEGIREFFENYLTGDDDPISSDSDDGTGNTADSVIMIHQMGALVRGQERLIELADCYVMHLDTTLYDLCLRRLRTLNLTSMALLSLPNRILHDLKRLYYHSFESEISERKSTSG